MYVSRAPSLLALFTLCISTGPTSSHAATLTSKLTFADLPTTITLCRDSIAIQTFGFDEQWAVLVDVDANALTGEPSSGAEYALVVQTIPQNYPCSPTVVATADALLTGVFMWDGGMFQPGPETLNLAVDLAANTMTLSLDTSGTLTGLSGTSHLRASAAATYKPTSASPTAASNNTASTTLGHPITDPSGNVQQCTSPCSAASPYYPYIDIVAFDPGNITGYGANTLTFEFHVASLPANMGLCRYPSAFASDGSGVDTIWLSAIDIDHDGSFDVAVLANTTPQDASCTSHTAPTATSVSAGLYTVEPGGGLVYVSDLPVSVDVASGTIAVQAPRNDPLLAGLSSSSVLIEQTQGFYAANHTIAVDGSPAFALGSSFNDPTQDVTMCTGNCSTGQPWYPQIDLVGGTVYGPDGIFYSGFE